MTLSVRPVEYRSSCGSHLGMHVNKGVGQGVRGQVDGRGGGEGRGESYPSRGQSLAVRVGAHGQGAVEPHTSICSAVSALEEREKKRGGFQYSFLISDA